MSICLMKEKVLKLLKFSKGNSKWPVPKFDESNQPHFLFIITPPYSGSTALSELLNSSHRTMILQNRGEGQWLVPGLCEKDRWNPDKEINYLSVKAVWLSTFQRIQRLVQNVDVVIEKSPPNMMRIEKLSSQFLDYSFIANNRNPYANCASILYRNHKPENLESDQRISILRNLAKAWLMRSGKIRELVLKLNIPLITYEEFCQKPSLILSKLQLPDGVSDTINLKSKVKVKDYKVQEISNQNQRQISNLTDEEIEQITDILKRNEELLSFFGYQSLC